MTTEEIRKRVARLADCGDDWNEAPITTTVGRVMDLVSDLLAEAEGEYTCVTCGYKITTLKNYRDLTMECRPRGHRVTYTPENFQ